MRAGGWGAAERSAEDLGGTRRRGPEGVQTRGGRYRRLDTGAGQTRGEQENAGETRARRGPGPPVPRPHLPEISAWGTSLRLKPLAP